ncbi:MAG: hypothetical protein PHV59_11855, partial [Victivallales bacterium]|nr:hypothetical protein [Victivallales bacterium]
MKMKFRRPDFKKNYLDVTLVILMLSISGCRLPEEKILPPPEKQPEKQYITNAPKADILQETTPAEPAAATVKTFVSAKEFHNVSKVEMNGSQRSGFLNNGNFVTRWNILGPLACP